MNIFSISIFSLKNKTVETFVIVENKRNTINTYNKILNLYLINHKFIYFINIFILIQLKNI